MKHWLTLPLIVTLFMASQSRAARLKDLAGIEGVRDNQLVGYGLVVGLAGTGDRQQTVFSVQSLTNMLERMGVHVSPAGIQVKNTAAVFVTCNLPPFARPGMRLDVLVSAIGDSQNLQGGTLIVSPLRGMDGQVYANAQGSVVTGGFLSGSGGTSQRRNHPTAGRVPEGAIVERPAPSVIPTESVRWVLHREDFTTARRIADRINEKFASGDTQVADASNSGLVAVKIPAAYHGRVTTFIADVEGLTVEADTISRVIVNERTGTIVIGGGVSISQVSILHGGLNVEIQTKYSVSQPGPLSSGSTQLVPNTTVDVTEDKAKSIQLPKGATVEQLARALISIGATPRDIISILQNLKASGALDAELEVI